MKKLLGIIALSLLFSGNLLATPPKHQWSPSIEKWKKTFKKAEYPPNDCKYCTERHDYWAYNSYRKASLKNRDYKNNGGLKKITIKPAKKEFTRTINKDVQPLPKEIYDYVYLRDISSLMILDNAVVNNLKLDKI